LDSWLIGPTAAAAAAAVVVEVEVEVEVATGGHSLIGPSKAQCQHPFLGCLGSRTANASSSSIRTCNKYRLTRNVIPLFADVSPWAFYLPVVLF
jgi:hypothetical protein